MKPDHFSDIIATNALYRPGPLEGGMVDDYVAVKHKRKEAVYLHEVLKDILEETNGVMVYQEQVMCILNRLGGIELAAAYTCIKAISKKKERRSSPRTNPSSWRGRPDKGLTEKQAREMWEMILKFAGYGFNKCVVGNTLVTHAETGEQTTVGELFRNCRMDYPCAREPLAVATTGSIRCSLERAKAGLSRAHYSREQRL